MRRGAPSAGGGSALPLLVGLLALLAIVAGGGWWGYHRFVAAPQPPGTAGAGPADPVVTVVITPGEPTAAVAEELQRLGLISNATAFRALLRLRGAEGKIEAGTYRLERGMSMDDILDRLRHAPAAEVTLTVREGLRAEEVAALVADKQLTQAGQFLELVKAGKVPSLAAADALADRPPGASLDGYLFPDTYRLAREGSDASTVLEKMVGTFGERFTPAMRKQAANQKHTVFEVVTMASIVERESRLPEERPLIAGVYWNRLKAGMGLFADPTVQYALGFQKGTGAWWKRDLTPEDLKVNSPYNTYLRPGLPPGPICNPGLASLQAALEPQGDYLYFVAKGDGSHVFAHTLAEHNANVAKYQKPG